MVFFWESNFKLLIFNDEKLPENPSDQPLIWLLNSNLKYFDSTSRTVARTQKSLLRLNRYTERMKWA
jgi:hypothetical protein